MASRTIAKAEVAGAMAEVTGAMASKAIAKAEVAMAMAEVARVMSGKAIASKLAIEGLIVKEQG